MQGVTILDSTEDGRLLAFDLTDILQLLGPLAVSSEWIVSAVECVDGPAAEELHRLADANARLPGQTLLSLAAEIAQVIDGLFIGYREGEERPWIIVRAVDGSAFDVQSDDEAVLALIQQRFRDVTGFTPSEPLLQASPELVAGPLTGPELAER